MTVPTPPFPDPDRDAASSGAYDPWAHRPPAAGGQAGGAHPSPWPAAPGGGHSAEKPGPRVGREVTEALFCTLAVTVLGVVLGLLWVWLAPRIPLFSDGKAVFLRDPEGEEAIGADGTFVLLALAAGAVTGVAVFLARRRGGVGVVVGLALGGLLASVVAWRTGIMLGPDTDVVATAKAVGEGNTFDGPLELRAKGALLAWPMVASIVHLLLTGMLVPDDDEAPAPAP